ncbi:hypothetical protein ES703_22097 [subsurface metagenome]
MPLAAYQMTQEHSVKTTRTMLIRHENGIQPLPVVGHGIEIGDEIKNSPVFQKIKKKGEEEDWEYGFTVGETPIPERTEY